MGVVQMNARRAGVVLCRCGLSMLVACERRRPGRRTRLCSRPLRAQDRWYLNALAGVRSRQLIGRPLGGTCAESRLDHNRVLVALRLANAVLLRMDESSVGCRPVVLGVVPSTLAQPTRKRTPVVLGVVPVSVV